MTYRQQVLTVAAVVLWGPLVAGAQAFGNSALFAPEVDVVSSGVVLDARATVTPDRKYVTMTVRASNAELLNLFVFRFQQGGGFVQLPAGFVGGVNPVIAGAVVPTRPNAPARVAPGNGGAILLTRGITPLVAGG